jgi:hypothetical protein
VIVVSRVAVKEWNGKKLICASAFWSTTWRVCGAKRDPNSKVKVDEEAKESIFPRVLRKRNQDVIDTNVAMKNPPDGK